MKKKNLLILLVVILITLIPIVLQQGSEFGGADGQAEEIIAEINPEYKPWFSSVWEPPSGEIESLLFAVQAGIGTGVIGYYLGYQRGKRTQQGCDSKNVKH